MNAPTKAKRAATIAPLTDDTPDLNPWQSLSTYRPTPTTGDPRNVLVMASGALTGTRAAA